MIMNEKTSEIDAALNAVKMGKAQGVDIQAASESVTDIDMKQGTDVEAIAEPIVEAITKKPSPQGGKWNRATFLMDPLLVAKMKVVASVEQQTYKKTVEKAFSAYLKTWQISHPYVNLDKVTLKKRGR